ncbi:hypothetical protein SEUCBS139899_010655 [Sporothrix eucalyptigena]
MAPPTTTPGDTTTNEVKAPTDPCTMGDVLNTFLQTIQTEQGPRVVPKTISFKDGRQRGSWENSMPDAGHRATVAEFVRYPLGGRTARLGLICCPTENWVAQQNKPKQGEGDWEGCWHASAVGLFCGDDGGKHLVVWDCDPTVAGDEARTARASTLLRGVQRDLWREVLKAVSSRCRLWYNTDAS